MKYSLDRIEGEYAVLIDENGIPENVPLSLLPKESKEGSMLLKNEGGYLLDAEETKERRKKLFELQNSLFSGGE